VIYFFPKAISGTGIEPDDDETVSIFGAFQVALCMNMTNIKFFILSFFYGRPALFQMYGTLTNSCYSQAMGTIKYDVQVSEI